MNYAAFSGMCSATLFVFTIHCLGVRVLIGRVDGCGDRKFKFESKFKSRQGMANSLLPRTCTFTRTFCPLLLPLLLLREVMSWEG